MQLARIVRVRSTCSTHAAPGKRTRRKRYPPRHSNHSLMRGNFEGVPQFCGFCVWMNGRSLWVPSGPKGAIPPFQVSEDLRARSNPPRSHPPEVTRRVRGFLPETCLGLGIMKPKTCPTCKRPIPMSKTERAHAGAAARWHHRRSKDDAQPQASDLSASDTFAFDPFASKTRRAPQA